jgi:drug/metabolite transporter (DMT)-like permease
VFSLGPGIGYAILAAFVWGGYIFALKRYFSGYPDTVLTVGINAAAIAWYLPLTATRAELGAVPSIATLGVTGVAVALGTVVATAAAFLLFLQALGLGDVSYVAPISKIIPVFVLPVEVLVLHERLTSIQVAGVVVATVAVYVANYRSGPLLAPLRKAATARSAQFALASAACFALGDVGKRVVLQELAVPLTVWVPALLGGVLVIVLPLAVREWVPLREALPQFVLAGGVVAVAEHATSLAFATVPASIASPIINTQAIVAVVLGGVILREEAFGIRLAAAGLAAVGVGLIAA